MNLDRNHLRLLNYINLVKGFFSLINIAYAHATQTHSIQSTQFENFIIYVKFFGGDNKFWVKYNPICYIKVSIRVFSKSSLPN